MTMRKCGILVTIALSMILFTSQANAHWCDDLWASSYNIVVRPDSDTSPKEVYVQNNMGYQLISFKLTATGSGGAAITLTAPTTLKVSGTLLPGEKGTWKIASGSPAKIEDVTFDVSFGNSGQSNCYPTKGAKAVMIVKKDGTLSPSPPPPGLDSPVNPGCVGDLQQGRSLQYEAVADFEDVNTGLDKLLQLYCAGRGSWNSGSEATVPSNCKDTSSTTCPAAKSGSGSKYDYMHLWSAGELAIRKASLGARAAVFRARLQCGANDSDVGFGGYAMFVLGYLGDDATAKTFLTTQAGGSGDLATIAKAALYLMGDTTQKAAVQTGAQSSSVFVKVACAGALGIVDQDDATVTSAIIPQVKWTEPDTSDDGKGMYAAHILELVAFSRRGWVANGVGTGAVTFYGETGSGAGGATGTGGATGMGGAGSGGATGAGGTTSAGGTTGKQDAATTSGDARPATGGAIGSGGATGRGGASGSSGATGSGGANGSGGASGSAGGATGSGGATSSSGAVGTGGSIGSGGAAGKGGASGSGGSTGTDSTVPSGGSSPGCTCNLGSHGSVPAPSILIIAASAFLLLRRRRR